MQPDKFHKPEAEAMERLLQNNRNNPTGVILRLAWREGLTRAEISGLTWERVDFSAMCLRLPDREIPLEEETASCLRERRELYEDCSPYVAISEKRKERLAPPSISRLARTALDSAGQNDVRLIDLRLDFVRRQMEEHDWPYVLRVSGLSVTTYRTELARLRENEPPTEPPDMDDENNEFKLWKIMQAEKASPAGIALWLSQQAGLRGSEIAALIWDQIDWSEGVAMLASRRVPLTQGVLRVLSEEKARRAAEDDPHVLLTPRTRKPMTLARLSTLVRTALVRGGIDDLTMADFRRQTEWDRENKMLLDYAHENGSVARGEVQTMLGLTASAAYDRLIKLVESGDLVRINTRYYPAAQAILPEHQEEEILRYIAKNGAASREDVAQLLHIGKNPAGRILKRMAARGELVLQRSAKLYTLPR